VPGRRVRHIQRQRIPGHGGPKGEEPPCNSQAETGSSITAVPARGCGARRSDTAFSFGNGIFYDNLLMFLHLT